ncbi:hypothetical protein [Haloferula sargassicola]|uniref:Prepilin-type N-terminal cleavage/methylation domain-containing protein n=1 Tax=Haloferula sargassicola TaxID=490096 RepID=A0ABP9UUK2_9BACT
MKLQKQTKRAKGMTLLELTVVILVLLSLISILFVGARAWKKGSDRSACILNIRNVQQATRGYQNMHPEAPGCTAADIYSDDGSAFLKTPKCPAGGTYTPVFSATAFPATGVLAITCDKATTDDHVPASYSDW